MLRCKEVAEALAKYHYWELPWARRIGLKLHVALCIVCGRFHRQVMLMQDAARIFHSREESDDPLLRIPMPDESKRRLKEKIASEIGAKGSGQPAHGQPSPPAAEQSSPQ